MSTNGDKVPEATPAKLKSILERAHALAQTRRAIANTARGRRVKAQKDRKDKAQ